MRDIDLNKMSEGIDYEVIPAAVDNEQAWDIRFLRGDFVETVIRYGAISFDGKEKCLRFNFTIISSPDPDLDTTYVPLQEFAADVLEDVLEKSHANGTLTTAEMDAEPQYLKNEGWDDDDGDQFRTDDSEESTD